MAIDTSALIAIFRLEPEADRLLKAIVSADRRLISALSVLEASMVMSGGAYGAAAFEPLDEFLAEAGVEVVAFDAEQAQIARAAFLRYGKGRHKAALNLGDCASYALAKAKGVPLLFKGGDFGQTDVMQAVAAG
nr:MULTISPECIES: type II toxin-antitoxin system VapC family toxin [Rhodomicrobium]